MIRGFFVALALFTLGCVGQMAMRQSSAPAPFSGRIHVPLPPPPPPPPPPGSGSPGPIYSAPTSIPADCSADAAPALDAWIASVPDGTSVTPTVVTFPSNACYDVEESLLIWQRNWIDVEGNGALFKAVTNGTGSPYIGVNYGEPPGPHFPYYAIQNNTSGSDPNNSRAFIDVDDSRNITLHGLKFLGPQNCTAKPYYTCYNGSLESQAGFIVSGGSNITMTANTISHVWGDCAQVGAFSADAGGWLNSWTFSGNACDHLARHGWSSNGGEHFTVTSNTYSQVAYDAMDMEDDGGTGTTPPGCNTGCRGGGWANVNEHGDTFTGVAFYSIVVQCGTNCTAENLTFDSNSYDTAPQVTVFGIAPDPYVQNVRLTNNRWGQGFQSSYRDSLYFGLVNGGLIAGNTMPQNCYDWSSIGQIPCQVGVSPHTYQQRVALSIDGSSNVAVQNNNLEAAARPLEINSNNGSAWTGPPSINVTECGNQWGVPASPSVDPAC